MSKKVDKTVKKTPAPKKVAEVEKQAPAKTKKADGKVKKVAKAKAPVTSASAKFVEDVAIMAAFCRDYADELSMLAKDAGVCLCTETGKPLSKKEIAKEVSSLREAAAQIRQASRKYLNFTADKLTKIVKK